MKKFKYLIIGGGTTAGYAAKEFVNQGLQKDELCILSAEETLPIDRPPLSKDFFTDKDVKVDDVIIKGQEFYDEHGIEIQLGTEATAVDFNNKTVRTNKNGKYGYDKLLIATGSQLRRLTINGSDLGNIHYLRTVGHSKKIREAAEKAEKIIVLGGQYIGTEMTSSLSQIGKKVTMVFPEDRLLSKFATADIAAFFHDYYYKKGIEIIHNDTVIRFNGNGRIEEALLQSGKRLETDMAIAGIGVEPNTWLFEDSDLNIDDGIVVNKYLETSIPDVYAAGDVARFPDLTFEKMRRVEHWENAYEGGTHAAKVMAGKREPYKFLPFFFSDVFDLSYEYFGDNSTANLNYNRGKISSGDFSSWWFHDDILVAAFVMSSRPEGEGKKAREWITGKTKLDPRLIENEELHLDTIIKE